MLRWWTDLQRQNPIGAGLVFIGACVTVLIVALALLLMWAL